MVARDLAAQGVDHVGRAQVELVEQEGVLADHMDVVGAGCLWREIAEILGDQDLSATPDGGGQDMPIFRIIGHLANESS